MSEPQSRGNAFEDVDRSGDPAGRVRYLDAVRAQGPVGEQKRITLDMMHLTAGDAGLDVGCGTGDDVIAIARIVGPKGSAAGVDTSETMIEEARRRAAAEGVQADFRCTDGATLPFADATFHAARIERVLIHVESPDAVLAEMMRVTRPGGRIVALEPDFGASLLDSPHRDIRRKLAVWIQDVRIRNSWMGRELWRRFREAGLRDVDVQPLTHIITGDPPEYDKQQSEEWVSAAEQAGALTRDEADLYLQWLRETYAAGAFFSSRTMFAAVGSVP